MHTKDNNSTHKHKSGAITANAPVTGRQSAGIKEKAKESLKGHQYPKEKERFDKFTTSTTKVEITTVSTDNQRHKMTNKGNLLFKMAA